MSVSAREHPRNSRTNGLGAAGPLATLRRAARGQVPLWAALPCRAVTGRRPIQGYLSDEARAGWEHLDAHGDDDRGASCLPTAAKS